MKNLTKEDFYGKDLYYILTEFKNDELSQNVEIKKVFNPKVNFNIGPSEGCDMVIGDRSTNSKYIYEIKDIIVRDSFPYYRYQQITYFNYCTVDNLDIVKALHIEKIKESIKLYIHESKARIQQANKDLISIEL